MKFLFIVQGEGRGHLTQAITLFKILKKNGHDICHVVVGKSKRRLLPDFFSDNIQAPILQLNSPNFVTDKKGKSVRLFQSIIANLIKLPTFLSSVNQIEKLVKKENPDVILNFYDFLGGLYYLIKNPAAEHIAIAHQFFVDHPKFKFPKGRFFDKTSMKFGNKLSSFGARKKLALSFREYEDREKLSIVPPLLRDEIKSQETSNGSHFLVYLVNHGYAQQVERFHQQHPNIPIHCFWDKKDAPKIDKRDENLIFHQLNDTKFIALMASCRGYLTSAGFESVCEAMYMGKPVLMVPVKGHYEQKCNATDATSSGAGISSEIFLLEKLLDYIPKHKTAHPEFRKWCNKSEELFIKNLTNAN